MINIKPNFIAINPDPDAIKEIQETKASKRARKGIGKGKRGVNGACNMLSNWYGVFESFSPTIGSGGGRRFSQPADIMAPPGFRLILESKNDEGWNITQFLRETGPRGGTSKIWLFWEQVLEALQSYNSHPKKQYEKYPALILKKNFDEYLIMLEYGAIQKLGLIFPLNSIRLETPNRGAFYIFLLEEFLENNEPSTLFYSGKNNGN